MLIKIKHNIPKEYTMAKKILIIDDNPGDQRLMKEFIQDAGINCDISFASSGTEGIEKVKALACDLVILDTRLPDIDGFETCRGIKGQKQENIKVIVMTGIVDAVDAGKAREAGADGYCVKTSDWSNLIETVKEFI